MKFRKKPIVIEAVQFTGTVESCDEVTMFLGGYCAGETHQWDTCTTDGVTIKTLEGEMHAGPGDWIIKGIKGEFYPCRLDIFAASYEEAGATAALRDVGVTDEMVEAACAKFYGYLPRHLVQAPTMHRYMRQALEAALSPKAAPSWDEGG